MAQTKEQRAAKDRVRYLANREQLLAKTSAYYAENKDKRAAWQAANSARIAAQKKARYEANKEAAADYARAYRSANKAALARKKRAYNEANKVEQALARAAKRAQLSAAQRLRYATDPQYRLGVLLRNRVRAVLKGRRKAGSAVGLLGCSVPEAVAYLASLFRPGMTWDNHGEWHIDHAKPLAAFDLEDPEQLAAACHYTNLQPLWALENLTKLDKYEPPSLALSETL